MNDYRIRTLGLRPELEAQVLLLYEAVWLSLECDDLPCRPWEADWQIARLEVLVAQLHVAEQAP